MRDLQSMRRAFGDNPVNFRTGVMPTFKINASISNNALWVSAVLSVKRRVKRQAVICRRHASMRATSVTRECAKATFSWNVT